MPISRIKLEICGNSYTISSTDEEGYILSLAKQLNQAMEETLDRSPQASVTTAAVLAALGYLDELEKATNGSDHMRRQISEYLEEAKRARQEAEDAKRTLAAAQILVEQTKKALMEAEEENVRIRQQLEEMEQARDVTTITATVQPLPYEDVMYGGYKTDSEDTRYNGGYNSDR
ncbi:MAG: cell division protein ZapA [Oscillospiraceae bacterium]|nr:cell division protein ZapA [Oscillospiraceae bacterium]